MQPELKIVMSGPSSDKIIVYVDGQPIGLIQDIKFHASVNDSPTVEIIFPNLFPFKSSNKSTVDQLEQQMDLLKKVPNVKVTLQNLKF